MIMKTLKGSALLQSVACRSFGVLLMDKYSMPSYYDFTDIEDEDLHNKISNDLQKKYLSPLSPQQKEIEERRTGIIYGINSRRIISIPTKFNNNNPLWVHYLICTGSPSSVLTLNAIQTLIGSNSTHVDEINVIVNGKEIVMGTSRDHCSTVNIIGMDFIGPRKLTFITKQSVMLEFQQ